MKEGKEGMQRLSKRRGVISVFLLIIFMVTFVFTGLLVDAARYRTAAVYLEASLDNASDSILSNYNQLLFDLYGLFSVDVGADGTGAVSEEEMKARIEELYNTYLDAVLNTGDIKLDEEYRTLLNDIFDEVSGKPVKEVNAGTENLYDFKIENLECGTNVTLADPANVESQIIEYMKFRAPVQLIDETQGFLEKIYSLLTMTDRVEEALTKTKITAKYEEPENGEKGVSEKAYDLQKEINEFAVKLYNYSVNPTNPLSSLGAASPENMFDRNNIYNKDPYDIKNQMLKIFDETMDEATEKFNREQMEQDDIHTGSLAQFLGSLKDDMVIEQKKNPEVEIVTGVRYSSTEGGITNQFTFIDFGKLEVSDKIKLAEEVYEKVQGSSEEMYRSYCSNYREEKTVYESAVQEIENNLRGAYSEAYNLLQTGLQNMESNAESLYNTISEKQTGLRDRMTEVVGLYESYIAELEAERTKNGGSQNKESVYAPEIELAEGNLAEILKNADILLNSRSYLYNIAFGFPDKNGNNREILSKWILMEADRIRSNREEYLVGKYKNTWKNQNDLINSGISEDEEFASIKEDMNRGRLQKFTRAESLKPTSASASKDMYATKYKDFIALAVGELLPAAQNHICILYSYASYFQTCYYRADVDVVIEGSAEGDAEEMKNTEINSEKDSKPEESQTGSGDENKEKLLLDNESMLRDPEYLSYLKMNYQHTSENQAAEETELGQSVTGKVTLKTLVGILETGLNLLNKLENLLEDARDNLYVDAYIMSMLPNYSDFQRYNAGEFAKEAELPVPFTKEYLGRNATFAAAEYIITGAGANGAELSSEIRAAQEVNGLGIGFGKLSADKMRMKLFGTRLLFNGVSMMTDTAKLKQAARMASWAHGLAPLVAAVIVIAWTIAETVIDVIVIMREPGAEIFDSDKTGEVYIFKQGSDWYFCLENAAKTLAKSAVNEVIDKAGKKAAELTKSLEQQTNRMIYDAYKQVKAGTAKVEEVLNRLPEKGAETINGWTKELEERIGQLELDGNGALLQQKALQEAEKLSGRINADTSFQDAVKEVKDKVDEFAEGVQYQAVIAVSRASEKVMEKTRDTVKKMKDVTGDFIDKNIQNVIPIGQVVNTGSGEKNHSPKMGYRDYLYFYLFFMNSEVKIKRLQSVIQANMMVSGQKGFRMETSPAAVWADLECSIKYLFLSDLLVPESMRRDGRLRLKVISGQSY